MDTNCAQYIWLDEATFQESELYIAVSYCPNTCTESKPEVKTEKACFLFSQEQAITHSEKQMLMLCLQFCNGNGSFVPYKCAWHPHGQWAWAGIIYQETGSIPISSQFSICPSWRMFFFFFSSHICQPYRVIYLENPRNKIKKKKTIKRRYLMI